MDQSGRGGICKKMTGARLFSSHLDESDDIYTAAFFQSFVIRQATSPTDNAATFSPDSGNGAVNLLKPPVKLLEILLKRI
jgi:hypothetical protein